MACGGCGRRRVPPNTNVTSSKDYDLAGGMDIRSLNDRQIRARLEVFKRKFCNGCNIRYECDYTSYLNCKGLHKK